LYTNGNDIWTIYERKRWEKHRACPTSLMGDRNSKDYPSCGYSYGHYFITHYGSYYYSYGCGGNRRIWGGGYFVKV